MIEAFLGIEDQVVVWPGEREGLALLIPSKKKDCPVVAWGRWMAA